MTVAEKIQIDQVVRSKRRTIALIIEKDGRVVVRAPLRVSLRAIREFAATKEEWIRAKQALVREKYARVESKTFADGEHFLFLGKTYPLKIVENAPDALELSDQFLLKRSSLPEAQALFKAWYRRQAGRVISERAAWYAARYGFQYSQVKITSAQTRWGSCSAKGTLSFAWRLVMAPLPVIDYVVVHELVHTIEKNHAKGFWERVRAIIPDYKQKRDWLEFNGAALSLS
ncbi:MAG TPA: SprT family zinc-dependent metalloprotease [Anaerolineaceae bacterium]